MTAAGKQPSQPTPSHPPHAQKTPSGIEADHWKDAYIYLDHAATTAVAKPVWEVMQPFFNGAFANPSSLHRLGGISRKTLEAARKQVADCLGASRDEIIFTAGGTESNNLALLGVAETFKSQHPRKKYHLITSAIEHPSVMEPCRYLERQGWELTVLPVDAEGFVSLETLAAAIQKNTVLVSIMHGNNEVGTLQPIAEIGALLRQKGILFHTDAVQTAGKVPIDLNTLPVDYLSVSAHKLYGPKGVGALYIRDGAPLPAPRLLGGGQEKERRSGTENIAGIVGLAKALTDCVAVIPQESNRLRQLQGWFIQSVLELVPTARLNGPKDLSRRIPGNVNVSFPSATGDVWVLQFDLKGIAVSSGSACHSAKIEPSDVVLAMTGERLLAQSTVRFSFGRSTTQRVLERVLEVLPDIMARTERAQQARRMRENLVNKRQSEKPSEKQNLSNLNC